MRRLFSIWGGVHPPEQKHLSAHVAIEPLPLPPLLHIPLQQHIGAAATPLVVRGDRVQKGQMLARSQGAISAPVHAPTSGRIMGVGHYPAHHPSGLSVTTITLQPDGADSWHPSVQSAAVDPFTLPPDLIAAQVAAAGIVGLGGATFPSAIKLNLRQRYSIHTLIMNGAECEPYLTCDDRLMQEQSHGIIDGIRLMAHALGVRSILVAIENNKPAAQQAMRQAAAPFAAIEVVAIPTRYPMGSEKHLVQSLIGQETPARGLTADIGVVVHNVATALAVHEAIRLGRPLIERVVTVSGGAVRQPKNLRVAIGTPLQHLIDFCGGLQEPQPLLISGGPMMGQPLPSLRVPSVKGSNGLLALTAKESHPTPTLPCIRCGRCVEACPCGLVPLEMAAQIRAGQLDRSVKLGLLDCIACGSCSFVCPAHIPLVQHFNYAKGELASRQRSQHKQGETKRLAETRTARLEAQQRAKREALLQRKKEQQAAAAAAQAAAQTLPSTGTATTGA